MTGLRWGSATDVGQRRQNNQDMVLESDVIFAVADGMGGHQGGEVASLTAIQALKDSFLENPSEDGLLAAIGEANAAVERRSSESSDLRNMGTTLTVVALVEKDGDEVLAVANVGDSRAYLLRSGEFSQLTDDHSVPQELLRQGQLSEAEAAVDPRRNILTRVLGASYGAGPDIQTLVPYEGDRILLCSDGLYNEVDDATVAQVLRTVKDPREAARELVDRANENGGADNISVVVVDVVDDGGRAEAASSQLAAESAGEGGARAGAGRPAGLMTSAQRNAELRDLERRDAGRSDEPTARWGGDDAPDEHDVPPRRVTARVLVFVLVLVLVFAGAAAAIGVYARGSYFVGEDNGTVAIFKGRPGGLLWFDPTVVERTDITLAEVPPARVGAVEAGHLVSSLGEGRQYVENLRPAPPASGGPAATTTTTAAALPGPPPSP